MILAKLALCLGLTDPYLLDIYSTLHPSIQAQAMIVGKIESDFNTRSVSYAGAKGVMQIMPETGKWLRDTCRIGPGGDNTTFLFDPHFNIPLGACFLTRLHKEFDGNTTLTLIGYNAGPSRAYHYLKTKRLNSQTARYVTNYNYWRDKCYN